MIDAWMRRQIDPTMDRIGRFTVQVGVRADHVTYCAVVLGLAATAAIAFEAYWIGLVLFLANRLLDGLDGAVARHSKLTDFGGYLDIVGDFIVYSAFVFGFALARPEENAVAAAFLILSFVGTGSSFLAYAIFAEKRKITTDIRGKKSLYYLGGLTEGSETIAAFVLMCLFSQNFSLIAWVFGALCWVTTITRVTAAAGSFTDDEPRH
ncbi:CDP-alcohol phosphatidyltransferase family protein [Pelagibius sp. Alg239-R121]|uniref:CDP-alcohol phosphatidyltransferase family protein n=1 Tax=Pelagibius sp. Alg239-R121 TaxID=2993448 RepID=UPI0024A783C6|nr:CDP-alcohol phosphatidyltransferase family protein [Pelagibius sp. Alg239-R121]